MRRQRLISVLIVPLVVAAGTGACRSVGTRNASHDGGTQKPRAGDTQRERFDASHWRRLMKVYSAELRERLDQLLPRVRDDELINIAWALYTTDAPPLREARRIFTPRLMKRAEEVSQSGDRWGIGQFLWLATGLQESDATIARRLGDRAFSAGARLIQEDPTDGDTDSLASFIGEWAELVPSKHAVQTLEVAIPNVGEAYKRAELLKDVGVILHRVGRRREAIKRFEEAVAQRGLDQWPEPMMAARNAFIAWIHVEPEVALPKALAQLGQYNEAWGGPDTLTAVVIGHAAQEIAKTDLARAIKMVREAPETEWSLGGVWNTRARAMVLLAEAIARQHPAEAEGLLDDALTIGWKDMDRLTDALLRLPLQRARRVFQRHFASCYERAGLEMDMGFPSVYFDEAAALLLLDPALVAHLAKRWGQVLAADPDAEGRATTNRTLTGLVSAERGLRLLHTDRAWPDANIRELIEWVSLLHRLGKSAVGSANPRLDHPGR